MLAYLAQSCRIIPARVEVAGMLPVLLSGNWTPVSVHQSEKTSRIDIEDHFKESLVAPVDRTSISET